MADRNDQQHTDKKSLAGIIGAVVVAVLVIGFFALRNDTDETQTALSPEPQEQTAPSGDAASGDAASGDAASGDAASSNAASNDVTSGGASGDSASSDQTTASGTGNSTATGG